jgi:hypothetical protein
MGFPTRGFANVIEIVIHAAEAMNDPDFVVPFFPVSAQRPRKQSSISAPMPGTF